MFQMVTMSGYSGAEGKGLDECAVEFCNLLWSIGVDIR